MTYAKGKLTHSDGTPCRGWDCAWRNDGGHHVVNKMTEGMSPLGEPFTEYWQRQLALATERSITAAEDSVKAAVLLLAYGARECLPEAARIHLSESDQGEWLWVDDIDGDNGYSDSTPPETGTTPRHPVNGYTTFDDTYGHAASCLYVAHLEASPYLHADLDVNGIDNGRYYIDIQEALA